MRFRLKRNETGIEKERSVSGTCSYAAHESVVRTGNVKTPDRDCMGGFYKFFIKLLALSYIEC